MKIPSEKIRFNFIAGLFVLFISYNCSANQSRTEHPDARNPMLEQDQAAQPGAQQTTASPNKVAVKDAVEAITLSITQQLKNFIAGEQAALAAKGFRSSLKIGNLDPRLQKYACAQAIKFEFSQNPLERANNTVLMSCEQDKPWKFYVTLELKVFASRVVASQGIARGALIEPHQLALEEMQINKVKHSGFSQQNLVAGMVAKRSIRAGRLITADLLLPPLLVDKGDEVIIVAANDKIKIKMQGTAMSKGRKGQQIRIKNSQSQRIISAYVEDRGLVSVNL